MFIKKFEIEGLFGRAETITATLDRDLVLFTGRNGAGKTSVLKLLWSIISGNILIGLREVDFRRVRLETDQYECIVQRLGPEQCRVELFVGGERLLFEDPAEEDDFHAQSADDSANAVLMGVGSSVFFPTFRRIEGGFSMQRRRRSTSLSTRSSDVEESLLTLSRRLTNEAHAFVSAISTSDIVTLLLQRFADL